MDCPVTDPEVMLAQDHACEQCDEEIADNWTLIKAMNAVYDAGRRAGQAEGARHGFAQGSFQGFSQGREYQRTGRLEPMSNPTIGGEDLEVTGEMMAAFGCEWEAEDRMLRSEAEEIRVDGSRRRAGLRAVLAIVRRDLS